MQEKIHELEKKVSLIIKDIDFLKSNIVRMDAVEKDLSDIKTTVVRMEMVDNNIFEKLTSIVDVIKVHKDNFVSHDKNEMEKYSEIDNRLVKIEKLIYAGIGIFIVLEILHKFKMLNFG